GSIIREDPRSTSPRPLLPALNGAPRNKVADWQNSTITPNVRRLVEGGKYARSTARQEDRWQAAVSSDRNLGSRCRNGDAEFAQRCNRAIAQRANRHEPGRRAARTSRRQRTIRRQSINVRRARSQHSERKDPR